MCAKYYENPTMLSKVTAENVGDVSLRHTVKCVEWDVKPLHYYFGPLLPVSVE